MGFPDEVDMTKTAMDLITKLIADVKKSKSRPARLNYKQLKAHPFFKNTNWKNIRSETAAIVPQVNSPTDTQNFDDFETTTEKGTGKADESFIGYTFKRPEPTTKFN